MTKTQKDKISENVHKINKMDSSKLNLFTRELFLAKPDMDKIVFERTLKACDARAKSFIKEVSPLAEVGEFRGDDLK